MKQKKLKIKRALALTLALTCMVTVSPRQVYAGEAVDLTEEVLQVEAAEETEDEIEELEDIDAELFGEELEEADAVEEEVEDADELLGDPEVVYSGGTSSNPDVIDLSTDLGKEFHVKHDEVHDNYYFKFEVKTAGTLTMFFEDDAKEEYDQCYFAISDKPHPSDTDIRSGFRLEMKTWDWENYKSYNVTWLNKKLDTFQTSFIPGTYYLWVGPDDDGATFTFSFLDFTPLEKKSDNEILLVDDRLGGTDHGTNDYYDFLEREHRGDKYFDDPMPEIELNKNYRGILTEDSREDYYHFVLDKTTTLYMTAATDYVGELEYELYYTEEFGGETIVQKEVMSPDFDKNRIVRPGKSINSYQLKNRLSVNHNQDSVNFAAGEYAIHFIGNRQSENPGYLGATGEYSFIISTGKPIPVTKLTLSETSLRMGAEGDAATSSIVATVAPVTATDLSVSFVVEPADALAISAETESEDLKPGQTRLNITAKKMGLATVTVKTNGTNAKGVQLEATCTVSVLEVKSGPAVATKQKVDLHTDDYLGGSFNKNDKWLVEPKGAGTVSKGVFTGKKEGWVTVTRRQTIDKKLVDLEVVKFYVVTPKYIRKDDKNKDIKTVTMYNRGDEVDITEYIGGSSEGITIYPTSYESSDKAGKVVTLDSENAKVIINGSGSAKITALYGSGKNAAKIVLTVKATLPTMKASVKIKQKKASTLSVTKLLKTVHLEADAWSVKAASYDSATKKYTLLDEPSELITIEPVAVKENYTKCKVTTGTEAGYAAVVVTVNGVDYCTFVQIP